MVTADEHRVRSPQNHLQRSGYYKCPSAHERTFSAEKKSYPFACKLSPRSSGSTSSCRVASPVIVPIVKKETSLSLSLASLPTAT